MTAPTINFTTTGRHGVKHAAALLVQAAERGDLQVRRERRWDVFLLNGRPCPDIRGLLTGLLEAGTLAVADPDAVVSLVVPR